MPGSNQNNLQPFEKGHKKLGGRKRGVPNKFPRAVIDVILAAAEDVGFNGRGDDGLIGYLRWLANRQPVAFAGLLGRVLPLQKPAEVRETLDLTRLTDNERSTLKSLVYKAQGWSSPDQFHAGVTPQSVDDNFAEKLHELTKKRK